MKMRPDDVPDEAVIAYVKVLFPDLHPPNLPERECWAARRAIADGAEVDGWELRPNYAAFGWPLSLFPKQAPKPATSPKRYDACEELLRRLASSQSESDHALAKVEESGSAYALHALRCLRDEIRVLTRMINGRGEA